MSLYFVYQKGRPFCLKEFAISSALAFSLITGVPALASSADAYAVAGPVIPELSVLISGPPIKDPGALLRYALPIDNKAIREVQKPLEDISESLKIAGVKALDSVERVSYMILIFSSQLSCSSLFCLWRNFEVKSSFSLILLTVILFLVFSLRNTNVFVDHYVHSCSIECEAGITDAQAGEEFDYIWVGRIKEGTWSRSSR